MCGTGLYYFALNPTSSDTGGLLKDDWTMPETAKLDALSALPATDVYSRLQRHTRCLPTPCTLHSGQLLTPCTMCGTGPPNRQTARLPAQPAAALARPAADAALATRAALAAAAAGLPAKTTPAAHATAAARASVVP